MRRWALGAGEGDAPAKYRLVRANPQEQRFHRIVLSPDMVLSLSPAPAINLRAWTCPAFVVDTLAIMRCPMHTHLPAGNVMHMSYTVQVGLHETRRVPNRAGSSLAPAALCRLGCCTALHGTLLLHCRDSVLFDCVCRSITIGQPVTLKPSKAWPGSWALKCCPIHHDMYQQRHFERESTSYPIIEVDLPRAALQPGV